MSRSIVLVDARTGAVDRGFADLGATRAVDDGRDGWFVGVGEGPGGGAMGAHLSHGGIIDRYWRDGALDPTVKGIQRVGSMLYVAGQPVVVAFDTRSGRRGWTSPRFELRGSDFGIAGLAVTASAEYVGGAFHAVGTTTSEHRGSRPAGRIHTGLACAHPAPYSDVESIAVGDRRVFLGGANMSLVAGKGSNVAALSTHDETLVSWPAKIGADDVLSLAVRGRGLRRWLLRRGRFRCHHRPAA